MRIAVLALLVPLVLAGCLGSGGPLTPASIPGVGDAARTVVHLADRVLPSQPLAVTPMAGLWRDVDHQAAEPTLGVTSTGTLFYVGSGPEPWRGRPGFQSDVLRSRDQGATWEVVTPLLPTGDRAPPQTSDPYVYVDPATDRVFSFEMYPGLVCAWLSYSDDEGDSWTTNPAGCGTTPPYDHQTLVAAPPRVLATTGYPNVVYQCVNRVIDSACARSVDGGHTWLTGVPAFLGVDLMGLTPNTPMTGDGVCGGLHGHLVGAPDGTLYLPREYCGQPWIAISEDDATTWQAVQVSDLPTRGGDPAVAVDEAGNVYYAFQDEQGLLMLSVSQDRGQTWSPPRVVSPPAVTATHLPAIAAGAEGRVVLAYPGTENLPDGYLHEDFQKPAADRGEDSPLNLATWNGYLAVIEDALAAEPVIQTTMVNDPADPLVRGLCGPGRCPGMYDFIDVVIGPDGRPWAAFVDACIETCATPEGTFEDSQGQEQGRAGAVATLAMGPSLLGPEALAPLS